MLLKLRPAGSSPWSGGWAARAAGPAPVRRAAAGQEDEETLLEATIAAIVRLRDGRLPPGCQAAVPGALALSDSLGVD